MMNVPVSQAFTPTRIAALVIILGIACILAYLRFAPGSDSVSVPPGAKAGDLFLHSCRFATENGSYEAECGTLVVPENRNNPQSRLIALPVTRILARSSSPAEPVFKLEGGPGQSNMNFKQASWFADDRDVVLVGYRGVDSSTVLECPEVESALRHSSDFLSEKSYFAYADGFRLCARRLTADGVDLAGYSLAQRIDDFEMARVALGYDKINLVSESAGTRTAIIYGWRYPGSIHRSVMIGVNPPGHFLFDPKITDEQIARYGELCSLDESCRKRTDDLAASMRQTAADMPDRWLFLPIDASNVRIASFFGLFETSPKMAPSYAPMVLDTWLSSEEGDSSGLWFTSVFADLLFPSLFTWGEYAATGFQDAWAADEYYAAGGDSGSILGNPGTEFAWAGGLLGDAWPLSPDDAEYRQMRASAVATLLVGGELDLSTPPQVATRELLPYLSNGHQVIRTGFGHTGSFWNEQSVAGAHVINTFFRTGQVDDSKYEPRVIDFTPGMTFTFIAKALAAMMIGIALVAVLSLLWMARGVSKHGSLGSRTSVAIRLVYPVVLGIGGWFLGVLAVMTTSLAVPLDSQLLAVVSAGIPIGLGIYLAWTRSVWTTPTKITGCIASVLGALTGGWLGYEAGDGLVALLTTIVGAAAGANLLLILLEMTRDLSRRPREAPAAPSPSARVTT